MSKKQGARPNKFLIRLYNMLSQGVHSNCVVWSESGTSFIISNIPEFTVSVLPQYFKHKNFSSFVRQLNMYDFHKERETGDLQVYSHPCFLKGDRDKINHVHRKTSEQYIESKPISLLEEKYNIISSKQKVLTEKISMLEQNYQELTAYNQSLLTQIFECCEREQKIEQLLMMFIERVKEVPEFLQPFYRKKIESEIVRPIPIPLPYQYTHY